MDRCCLTIIEMIDIISESDCHLGRNILNTLKKYSKDVNQIELVTSDIESHGSVRLRSIRMAQAMKAKGLKKGDLIVLSAVNHNDVCIPFIASFYLGVIPLGLSVEMKPDEIQKIIRLAKPAYVFADPEIAPCIQKILKEIGNPVEIAIFGEMAIEGFAHFSEFVQRTDTEESFECEDFDPRSTPALVVCSKRVTSIPKLVTLSHFCMFYHAYVTGRVATEEHRLIARYLCFSSLFWISACSNIITSCLMGTTRIHSIKSFCASDFILASQMHMPSITTLNQMMLCKILRYAEQHIIKMPSFRYICFEGGPFNQESINRFQELCPNAEFVSTLGCTEALSFIVGKCFKKNLRVKSNPHIQYKVVDIVTERKLGSNEPGELRIKSNTTFMGYYNDPEATSKVFDDDGWYKTGDLVIYDEEGNLIIINRIKEFVQFRNHEICTHEIERLIMNMPGVITAAVIGKPHKEDGEHPMAIVQIEPDADIKEYQVRNYIRDRLCDYKRLRGGVIFVESLPLTYFGNNNDKQLYEYKIDNNNEYDNDDYDEEKYFNFNAAKYKNKNQ